MKTLIKPKHYLIALAITSIFGAVFFWLQASFGHADVWTGFAVKGPVDTYFCECANLASIVREPINTWSNLPFLFFAVVFLLTGIRDLKNYSRVNMMSYLPIYSFMFALGGFYLFFSSTFFHMSLTTIGEQLDLSGVFFIVLLPFIYNVHKTFNIHRYGNPVRTTKRTINVFLTIFLALIAILTIFKWDLHTLIIVPILILLTAAGLIYMMLKHPGNSNPRLLLISSILMTIGISFFMLDNHSSLCNEGSLLQCHAIWHLCCSTAWYFLYLYLRSERVYAIYQLRVV